MPADSPRTLRAIFKPDKSAVVDELVDALAGTDWVVERMPTDDPDDVSRFAAEAAPSGADAVATVGGDGSLSLMLDGMLDGGLPLLIVPAGTVNLTAQIVGIDTVAAAAAALVAGETRRIDLGLDGHETFVINASSGYDAAVIDDAHDHSDARFGRLHFAVAAVRRLRRDRPRSVVVEVDGDVMFDGRAMSVIVMNAGQRASKSLDVAPDAAMDDGLLDVAVSRVATLPAAARVILRLVRGNEISRSDIVRSQGRTVDVRWGSEQATQRDGDGTPPRRSISYGIRPDAIDLVVGLTA